MSTASERLGVVRDQPLRAAFYVVTVAFVAFFLLIFHQFFFVLVEGWTAGFESPDHRIHLITISGMLFVFTLGLLAQLYQPERRLGALLASLLIVVTILVLGLPIEGVALLEEVGLLIVAVVLITALHPARTQLIRGYELRDRRVLALAVIGAIGLLAFAGIELNSQLTLADSHVEGGHYTMMAVAGVVIAAAAILAAFAPGRWRPLTWMAGVLALVPIGLGSLAFPGEVQGSALPTVAAVAVVIWAIAFVVLNEYVEYEAGT